MARQIKAEIVGDASRFGAATKEAVGHIGKMDAAVAGFVGGVALKGLNMLTTAVQDFAGQLGMAGDAFRADEVSQQRMATAFQNTLKNYAAAIPLAEKFAAGQARLGFEDDNVRESLATLVGITHDYAAAQRAAAIAQDLARAKSLPLADATAIVTKALQGNGKALKALGIDIHGAKTGAELLDAVQKNVKGSAEAYANTAAGKLEAANVKNKESWERIGSIVSRIQSVVLPLVATAFERVSTFVVSNLVPAFNQVWAAAQQIWKAFMDLLAPAINYIRDNFDSIKPVLIGLGIVVGVVVGLIVLAILAVIAVVVLLVAGIISMVKTMQKGLQQVIGFWNSFVGFISGLEGSIGKAAAGMWNGIWNSFKAMINKLIRAWNALKFTVPAFDFLGQHTPSFTLGTTSIPTFEKGTGPGGLPYTGLFYGHKGETVTPAGRSREGDVHIHIDRGAYIDGPGIDILTNRIARRLLGVTGT